MKKNTVAAGVRPAAEDSGESLPAGFTEQPTQAQPTEAQPLPACLPRGNRGFFICDVTAEEHDLAKQAQQGTDAAYPTPPKKPETKEERAERIERTLAGFTGTEEWFKLKPFGFLFTDGIKYLIDECGAKWLIDAIASYQVYKRIRSEPFQIWSLKKDHKTGRAVLRGFRDYDSTRTQVENYKQHGLAWQNIGYSGFPLESVKVYFENRTFCLPGER